MEVPLESLYQITVTFRKVEQQIGATHLPSQFLLVLYFMAGFPRLSPDVHPDLLLQEALYPAAVSISFVLKVISVL